MEFTEEERNKIEKLPTIFRIVLEALCGAIKRIIDGDCDEETITNTMATIDANSQRRYADDDLVNYEQAARILGLSVTNRMRFKHIMNRYGVKQVVMHNQKIGFLRSEVLVVKNKMFSKLKKKKV